MTPTRFTLREMLVAAIVGTLAGSNDFTYIARGASLRMELIREFTPLKELPSAATLAQLFSVIRIPDFASLVSKSIKDLDDSDLEDVYTSISLINKSPLPLLEFSAPTYSPNIFDLMELIGDIDNRGAKLIIKSNQAPLVLEHLNHITEDLIAEVALSDLYHITEPQHLLNLKVYDVSELSFDGDDDGFYRKATAFDIRAITKDTIASNFSYLLKLTAGPTQKITTSRFFLVKGALDVDLFTRTLSETSFSSDDVLWSIQVIREADEDLFYFTNATSNLAKLQQMIREAVSKLDLPKAKGKQAPTKAETILSTPLLLGRLLSML